MHRLLQSVDKTLKTVWPFISRKTLICTCCLTDQANLLFPDICKIQIMVSNFGAPWMYKEISPHRTD